MPLSGTAPRAASATIPAHGVGRQTVQDFARLQAARSPITGTAKEWRGDRALRRLEALLMVADEQVSLVISGNGDVIEPEHDAVAIGSGGSYALAAARALLENTELSPREICERSLRIAGDICIHTNQNLTIEELPCRK